MPEDRCYWVADGDLCLGPASAMPNGAPSWRYVVVTASESAMRAFLTEALSAGANPETVAAIRYEQDLPA